MRDIMKLDDNQIAPDQDLRDCCPECGALGEWWAGWIEHPVAGEIRAFKCEECGEEWAE